MKDVTTDLAERLALLHIRWKVAFGDNYFQDPQEHFLTTAHVLAEGLRNEDPAAVAKVRSVVDPGDLDSTEFWALPLGRVLFAAGGFGRDSLSRTAAAAVLDCSRQWVHELVSRGTLKAAPTRSAVDREVYVKEVREVLKDRLDRIVK